MSPICHLQAPKLTPKSDSTCFYAIFGLLLPLPLLGCLVTRGPGVLKVNESVLMDMLVDW